MCASSFMRKSFAKNKIFYDIAQDIRDYPNAWLYMVIGGRNTGKTYSALKYHIDHGEVPVFIKRRNNDVRILSAGNHLGDKERPYSIDLSPYKSINRDMGLNIKAFKIDDGLGAFYDCDEDGPKGSPVAYLLSLSAVYKYKGYDLSECTSIIFDEFIPQPGERTSSEEGEQLLALYKTVARAREVLGKPSLKLICLSNAENVFNHTCDILELTDQLAEMNTKHQETFYDPEREIFVRMLKTSDEIMEAEKKSGIYKAMQGTRWASMSFDNEFAFNDFSCVQHVNLKGYKCLYELCYRHKSIYIYVNEESGCYYMTTARGQAQEVFDLEREIDQRRFYVEAGMMLRNACIDGRMLFKKYSYYDLLMNFKQRFNIK